MSGLAALIVDDPAEAKAKKADEAPASPAMAAKPVAAVKKKPVAVKEKSKTTAVALASHAEREKAKKTPVKSVAAVAHAKASDKAKARPLPGNPANDSDVALLTAIVAHDKAEPFASLQNTASSAKAKPDGRNRDIVERKAGDTTESLLLRCKRLGSLEGGLCRSRICAGHWDTDAACSASGTQPKVSSADN